MTTTSNNIALNNLVSKVAEQYATRKTEFLNGLNAINSNTEILAIWMYRNLMTKTYLHKPCMSVKDLKAYIIKRYEAKQNKAMFEYISNIDIISKSGDLIEVKINIEWKRSAIWGSNPTAEMWYSYRDAKGNYNSEYFKSRSIGGCGYDKTSTTVAECLAQCTPLLKALYEFKELNGVDAKNHDLFGYGSGYGILPQIEGGVGVNCYNTIFNKIGFEFKQIASGNSFDVFTISKAN